MSNFQHSADVDATVADLAAGNMRCAARLISRIEDGDAALQPLLQRLFQQGGKTPMIGITGPPGAGKSTLVDQLVEHWRKRDERVAVLAVDPSSSRSGGAILGDRVRMRRHNTDAKVFIRSMSARGHLGGLASASGDALIVLDGMNFDRILIETVGVGQSEIDILHHADTVVVVQPPSAGDKVQAMKAGLLEIADIFAVNKSDASGADAMVSALREAASEDAHRHGLDWEIPIVKTQAVSGHGIAELLSVIDAHQQYLSSHPQQRQQRLSQRTRAVLIERLAELIRQRHSQKSGPAGRFEAQLQAVVERRMDPRGAAEQILGDT